LANPLFCCGVVGSLALAQSGRGFSSDKQLIGQGLGGGVFGVVVDESGDRKRSAPVFLVCDS
jgi:hypothetical protein